MSLPNLSSFFWYPDHVHKSIWHEEEPGWQYMIYYTYDTAEYEDYSRSINQKLGQKWYGEIIVFRLGYSGLGIVNMDRRRGDTEGVLWRAIERSV